MQSNMVSVWGLFTFDPTIIANVERLETIRIDVIDREYLNNIELFRVQSGRFRLRLKFGCWSCPVSMITKSMHTAQLIIRRREMGTLYPLNKCYPIEITGETLCLN